ncbi:hypothetical protein ACIBCU_38250 [Streptomyces sp. NPDC051064]|uniref:hypothetical protein n=1 Tax=Streptomyces sp. NPDC051064 TaxID=3365641 RepID=UPI0037A0B340
MYASEAEVFGTKVDKILDEQAPETQAAVRLTIAGFTDTEIADRLHLKRGAVCMRKPRFRLHEPSPPDEEASAGAQERLVVAVAEEQSAGALRAELERVRHEHALAVVEAEHGRQLAQAEAEHLREQLAARGEHIVDLQRALKALMPAPERPVLEQPSVPGQAQRKGGSSGALEEEPAAGGERRWWWRRS